MKFIVDFFSYDQCDNRTDHDTILIEAEDKRAANKIAESLCAAVAAETEDCEADNVDYREMALDDWLRRAEKATARYKKAAAELEGEEDEDEEEGK